MSDQFYQDVLLEHAKKPRNKKEIENPDFSKDEENPSCGDKISMTGRLDDGKICELGFGGHGCVISQATASLLTETCLGKTIDEILALGKDDILALINIELGPNRLRCALLSLDVLQQALLNLENKL